MDASKTEPGVARAVWNQCWQWYPPTVRHTMPARNLGEHLFKHFGCKVRLLFKQFGCNARLLFFNILDAKQDFCLKILGAKQDFCSNIWSAKQDHCSNVCGPKQNFCSKMLGAKNDFCSNIQGGLSELSPKDISIIRKTHVFYINGTVPGVARAISMDQCLGFPMYISAYCMS